MLQLFLNAFKTGKLRIPLSAIETTYTIRLSTPEVGSGQPGAHAAAAAEDHAPCSRASHMSISERTWLVPLFQQLKVKNRRIARDMLLWQEVKQPAGMSYGQWDDKVRQPSLPHVS